MEKFNVYEGIMQGLQEAIEYKTGDTSNARVRIFSTVDPIQLTTYEPDEIAKLRIGLNLSQKGFAMAIGVSPRTVESWEAGRSAPGGVATRMLYIIKEDNSLVDKLVAR